MNEKYYVTTPIYYVNDKPHIGHSYTTILADVLANYHRLLGTPTYFLTGTDEHGQKVQQAADKNGISAQEQCDQTVVRFQELWERLEITNDDFIRTTEERHKKIVQEVLQELFDKNEIYRAEYEGWYCVGCERFFTEKDLVDGNCPECGRKVESIIESNYFFRMSNYQQWLIEYIETHPEFIQPDFRANETLGFLKNNELQDLCISRPKSRLAWGIELPFDNDFVTYVWFDALLNYITAIGYKTDEETFKKWWPVNHHLIGKDILTTHTVYWPTMLKAMGVEMPKTIFAHGWWLTGRTKMSKSLGNVVNPMEMIDRYGVDAFRYFLIAEMTLGQDASFTEEAFVRRYNSDLANDLGNLLSRTANMLGRYCNGKYPAVSRDVVGAGPEKELWDAVRQAVSAMEESIKSMTLNSGLASVLTAVRKVNRYFEIKQPWTLAKEEKTAEVETTLAVAAEALRVCSALLWPVMPERMKELRTIFGLGEPDLQQLRAFGCIQAGTEVPKTNPLFPRVEPPKVEEPPKKEKKKKPTPEKKEKPEGVITNDDVMNVKLRTAKILEAEWAPRISHSEPRIFAPEVRNMKTLILVRHGEFVKGDPFIPDIGSPLTKEGKCDVAAAAERFAELGIKPDLILSSPARRTGESAGIFAKKIGVSPKEIRIKKELFEAEKREILRTVHELDNSLNSVMIIGHNPAVTDLLHHLVSTDVYNLKLCTFAVLELSVDQWRDAIFGKAELAHFNEPPVTPLQITWRDKFQHWQRNHIQKIELFFIFLVGTLLILGIIALAMTMSGDSGLYSPGQ